MTALEELYKQYLEATDKPMEEFYENFRDSCPSVFFKGACNLCKVRESDVPFQMCCVCWLQEV